MRLLALEMVTHSLSFPHSLISMRDAAFKEVYEAAAELEDGAVSVVAAVIYCSSDSSSSCSGRGESSSSRGTSDGSGGNRSR